MFNRCFPFMLIILILSGCHQRSSAPEALSPGPSPKRAAARAAMKPPTPTEALLSRIRNENRAIDFGRPAPVTFTWRDAKGAELPAAGAVIAARVKLNGDYTSLNQRMTAIAESLIRDGFARDQYNSTEIIDGLINGSTVAAIRATCPGGGGDCMLDVRIGNLKK